jgi:hypothetical protein
MKRFVVVATGTTAAQQNAISQYLCNRTLFGFWHWSPETWLVVTNRHELNAQVLRDTIVQRAPGAHFIVIAVERSPGWPGWAFFGPKPQWQSWLEQSWDAED